MRVQVPITVEDVYAAALVIEPLRKAKKARSLGRKTLRLIGRNAGDLGGSTPAIIEAALKAAIAWRNVADRVRVECRS